MKKIVLIVLGFCMLIVPLTAELWSSSSPLIMSYGGEVYFPAFEDLTPATFDVKDQAILTKESFETIEADWMIWPVNKWGPRDIDKSVNSFPGNPSSDHFMGTDDRGRDVFAIILYGLRVAYLYSFVICLISLAIGLFMGGFFGFYGGIADLFSQRIVEVLSLIPSFFLILLALSLFDSSVFLLIAINSLLGWMGICQMTRVETLKVRKLGYVEAAFALGSSKLSIFVRHIFPNTSIPVLTQLPFLFMGHIVGLAILDYLGLGISTQFPSIGGLISQGQQHLNTSWWIIFYPSMILTLFLMGWVLIGENLRKQRY